MLDVRLLGPVRLLRDGAEVTIGGAKQRAVLAMLALEAPRAVSLESLVDGIWGDQPPASARNAVQVYVSGLRKAFGDADARIDRSGDAYRLIGAALRTDVGAFTQQVAEGRSALRSNTPDRAADLLREALSSWDGIPFGGLEDLPLHAVSRRLVDDERAVARAELVDALLRSRRLPEAIATAQEAVRERPLDEHGWAQLAAAQFHGGRQAESLSTLRRLRSLLVRELGVDPSPEVVDVESQIRAQTLAAPWADEPDGRGPLVATAAGQRPLPPLPSPFVGRDDVVERVAALLTRSRAVTLVGLGGMGKTTVSLAVAHRLRETLPATHFCELHAETTAQAALERVCRDLGLDPGDDPVATLSGVAPGTLVVLDNAEQVDGLGAALARALRATPLSFLTTSRRPLRLRDEDVVRLEPLSTTPGADRPSAAAELFLGRVEQVRSGASRGAAAEAERLCALLDGIPLAIELAASRARALAVEQLARRLDQGRPEALRRGRRNDLPERQESLAVVLDATLELLDPGATLLVHQLASFGGWSSAELVEEVYDSARSAHVTLSTATGDDEFVDALEDLADVGLAEVDGEGRVRLRPPVRDHVAGMGSRHEVDARVTEQVVRLVGSLAPTLHGPTAPEGVRRLSRDHDPVVTVLARAIEEEDAATARSVVFALGRYWLLAGRLVEGRRWIEAARALPHPDGDRILLDLLAGTYGSYLNDASAMALLDDALCRAEVSRLPVDRLVVNGACCLAAVAAHLGDLDAARRHAARAAGLAELSGDPTLVALARDLAGHVASYTGDADVALEATLAGIADARRAGDRFDLVNLLASAAESLVELGRGVEAVDVTDEAFELTRGLDVGPVVAHVLMMRGLALTQVERVGEARGCLIEALRISHDRYPDRFIMGAILTALAVAAATEGDDVGAARLWGSGDAVFADEGAVPASRAGTFLRSSLEAVARRLGHDRTATLQATGAADPDDVVARLLGSPRVQTADRARP